MDELRPELPERSKKAQVPYCVCLAWSADGATLYSGELAGRCCLAARGVSQPTMYWCLATQAAALRRVTDPYPLPSPLLPNRLHRRCHPRVAGGPRHLSTRSGQLRCAAPASVTAAVGGLCHHRRRRSGGASSVPSFSGSAAAAQQDL